MEGRIEVAGRQGRRRKQLPDIWGKTRGYWRLKKEALDRAGWRTRFGRGYGPVLRRITKWMNERHATECHLIKRQWSNQTREFPPLENLKIPYLVHRTSHWTIPSAN